jgi:hypothetical protein
VTYVVVILVFFLTGLAIKVHLSLLLLLLLSPSLHLLLLLFILRLLRLPPSFLCFARGLALGHHYFLCLTAPSFSLFLARMCQISALKNALVAIKIQICWCPYSLSSPFSATCRPAEGRGRDGILDAFPRFLIVVIKTLKK